MIMMRLSFTRKTEQTIRLKIDTRKQNTYAHYISQPPITMTKSYQSCKYKTTRKQEWGKCMTSFASGKMFMQISTLNVQLANLHK